MGVLINENKGGKDLKFGYTVTRTVLGGLIIHLPVANFL